MHKIAILLESYKGDIGYVERQIPSFNKHNADNIPLYIVVPGEDLKLFEKFVGGNITLMSEESVTQDLVHDDRALPGVRPGYVNQAILKLAFWEKRLCENYFCMDSDGVFIRDFFVSDFMYDENTPYTVLVEDNELMVEPEYYQKHWVGREKSIRKIQKELGLLDKRMLTCHAFAVFSCKVLESFHKKFLLPRKWTYVDLWKISPYEFSWYNMWLQKDRTIPIEFREPIIKYFHHRDHHLEYLRRGVTVKDIARGYIGYNINSNYSRDCGVVSYEEKSKYELSKTEMKDLMLMLMDSTAHKFKRKLKKIGNILHR